VLTTTAHDSMGHVHDRAPVIVPPEMCRDWLNPGTTEIRSAKDPGCHSRTGPDADGDGSKQRLESGHHGTNEGGNHHIHVAVSLVREDGTGLNAGRLVVLRRDVVDM
jgi:hypothetical protein